MPKRNATPPVEDPLWYKDAVIYELHVRAFADSDGDGVGDFRGLTEKLDYLHDLGVTAVWLLPFYPSPLKDDGYDIASYTQVHPTYGTLADFKAFLREAHARGIRVITELVINHTSDQHPWFQRARRAPPGSRHRNFYVWSDTPDRYAETRIIFKDTEHSNWTWDPVAGAYCWHRFYSHQPDLNFDNPDVRAAILQALDFWLDMGVDGMRLDAVPYLFEREGTHCENLPETHEFLRGLRAHVESRRAGVMFLAEANQWPEDAVAYFGAGDECHMNFHFPLMPRMFMALRMEDRTPIIDILDQTPAIPENCQWAIFLRNHDELTLEMVTDEERDYMYRVYARDRAARINLGIRRRLAPLLGNNRPAIELMNALLFSLGGTPVVYYGDEIGMGDNVYLGDRNGVRTPMQWSADRNAGFSRGASERLYFPVIIEPEYHFQTINAQTQHDNPNSLLWWMRRIIALRKRHPAFSRGTLEFLHPENRKVLAYVRRSGSDSILVVANLSRFTQFVELSLPEFKGATPVEMFGRAALPPLGEQPLFLTLVGHSFYWLALEAPASAEARIDGGGEQSEAERPTLRAAERWDDIFHGRRRREVENVLARRIHAARWFRSKTRAIQSCAIRHAYPVGDARRPAAVGLIVEVAYAEGEPELYQLLLAHAGADQVDEVLGRLPPGAAFANIRVGEAVGLIYDAAHDPKACAALFDLIARRGRVRLDGTRVAGNPERALKEMKGKAEKGDGKAGDGATDLSPHPVRGEQSNTSIIYGRRFILKFMRRVEPGLEPDSEIKRFLAQAGFRHVPRLAGSLELEPAKGEAMTLAMLEGYAPNEGDAWSYTLDSLRTFFAEAVARRVEFAEGGRAPRLIESLDAPTPAFAREAIGPYLAWVELLGARSAQMHSALASEPNNPRFAPEPITPFAQRSLYQSMRNLSVSVFRAARQARRRLEDGPRSELERLLEREERIRQIFASILGMKITARQIRCHGDFHLGQALTSGGDIIFLDFEGEPSRPLNERRFKRLALRDVAGMLRSFDYALHAALREQAQAGLINGENAPALAEWGAAWLRATQRIFLRSYLETAGQCPFLPASRAELAGLLDVFLMEKAVYEVGYELNNRPAWLSIPVGGIIRMLGE